jgi:hypothetical protein
MLEEIEIARRMNSEERIGVHWCGMDDLVAAATRCGEQHIGPRGPFRAFDKPAPVDEGPRVVTAVPLSIDNLHISTLRD